MFLNNVHKCIIKKIMSDSLTYLDEMALIDLYETTKALSNSRGDGIIIEAGCALGGSAILIASAKDKERKFFVYDVFGMIPEPSEKDDLDVHKRYFEIKSGNAKGLDGNLYYGYRDNLFDQVVNSFSDFGYEVEQNNISLIKGLFQDTLKIDQPVLMAHIDGDWYDSVMVCLDRICPLLIKGGVLIIDDYYAWSGCKKAVDDYFSHKENDFLFCKDKSRLHIIKL